MISRQSLLDKTGMWTSAMCAVHCIAVPIVISFSAFSSWTFLHSERMENVVLAITASIAVGSLVPSYIKHHRRALPMIILLLGCFLIGLSRLLIDDHESITVSSGAALVA